MLEWSLRSLSSKLDQLHFRKGKSPHGTTRCAYPPVSTNAILQLENLRLRHMQLQLVAKTVLLRLSEKLAFSVSESYI